MKYLVLIYDNEQYWAKLSPPELNSAMKAYKEYRASMEKAGVLVAGEALQPTSSAVSVRVRHGKMLKTDGPFAETKEQLGGFYIIDVKTADEAAEWAAKCPSAPLGTIEVRPLAKTD